MKYTQNRKIMQITDQTLILGIDIASEEHYARAFNNRGIEYGKTLKFSNDAAGFKELSAWSEALRQQHDKSRIVAGMEPTGHYWFPLAGYLREQNTPVLLVNPYHVSRSKELDDNTPTKTDRKDPKTIALLVKDGRYSEPYIPEGVYSELRIVMESRWQIVKQLVSIRNRVQRWLSLYFPEFHTAFSSWEGKSALIILQEMPTPEDIIAVGEEGILRRWQQDKIRGIGSKRAKLLVEAARNSIGIKAGIQGACQELSFLLETYALYQQQYQQTLETVEELTKQIPCIEEALKIPGIGLITIAGFVAEVGDVKRFTHPDQVQKLAGLNLAETSSGKCRGQTKISKRGRKRLRSVLYQAMFGLVAKNAAFRELHKYYTTRSQNPLKKKQSLIALGCKLIRILFAILRKGIAYDGKKMMADIRHPNSIGNNAA